MSCSNSNSSPQSLAPPTPTPRLQRLLRRHTLRILHLRGRRHLHPHQTALAPTHHRLLHFHFRRPSPRRVQHRPGRLEAPQRRMKIWDSNLTPNSNLKSWNSNCSIIPTTSEAAWPAGRRQSSTTRQRRLTLTHPSQLASLRALYCGPAPPSSWQALTISPAGLSQPWS